LWRYLFSIALLLFSPKAFCQEGKHQPFFECFSVSIGTALRSIPSNQQEWDARRELEFPLETRIVWRLGSGQMGGTVYRGVLPNGTAFVRKLYNFFRVRNQDVERFEILRSIEDTGFKIPNTRPIGTRGLEIQDIQGQPLSEILARRDIDEPTKARLEKKYTRFTYNLAKALGNKFGSSGIETIEGEGHIIRCGIGGGHEKIFYLRKSNIVVTPSGDFYIIDPF